MPRPKPDDPEIEGWTIAGIIAAGLFFGVCAWLTHHPQFARAGCYMAKGGGMNCGTPILPMPPEPPPPSANPNMDMMSPDRR